MARARTWTVEITITEHEDDTRPHAVVRAVSQFPPEVVDEPATARALANLAYKVLDVSEGDVQQVARRPMRMLS